MLDLYLLFVLQKAMCKFKYNIAANELLQIIIKIYCCKIIAALHLLTHCKAIQMKETLSLLCISKH